MSAESIKGNGFWCNNSAALDNTAVVPKTYANVDKSTASTSLECNHFAVQQESSTQATQNVETTCLPYFGQFYADRGFSKESTEIICASCRASTTKQYQVYFGKWRYF